MKVLISPIGMNDPFGKEATDGSALSINFLTQPDHVILLPTQATNGSDTMQNATKTKEQIERRVPNASVEIVPVPMEAANNYDEAIHAYGAKLQMLAAQYPDAELLLNASSGTPAIKLACLLFVAEGYINAAPYYADDPTQTRKSEAERIYTVDVTFLRESALVQRTRDLLTHGQFALVQEPLKTLAEGPFRSERKQNAAYWLRLAKALYQWDERVYKKASGSVGKLLREWKEASDTLKAQLENQKVTLERLEKPEPEAGAMAWDIYFHAQRLHGQGHLASAMEHYWIAIENSAFECLERAYHAKAYGVVEAANKLYATFKDNDVQSLWSSSMSGTTYGIRFGILRDDERNECIHRGKVASLGVVNETRELAQKWIAVAGCAEPANYPLSPDALQTLAGLFG